MAVFVWFSAISLIMMSVDADPGNGVPAMFVFGDSLIDPGNNNNLMSFAKANYFPHGIDFPDGATGRFCNGKTVADYLGNLLGLPLIPPFNNPNTKGSKILNGVNFASSGSGILNDSGKQFWEVWPMDKQIENFQKILVQLGSVLPSKGVIDAFVVDSLFLVSMGSNDYLGNFLYSLSDTSRKYTLEEFHALVIQEYSRQLTDLYKLGGRNFLIAGLGPLGCIPFVIEHHNKNLSACVDRVNEIASQFNTKVKMLVKYLNTTLTGSNFLFWDIYDTTMKIINNSSTYGFKYIHRACCGTGKNNGKLLCLPLLPWECRNRSEYVFWDPYHPTDAFNAILVKEAFQGNPQSTYPMNIQQLLHV